MSTELRDSRYWFAALIVLFGLSQPEFHRGAPYQPGIDTVPCHPRIDGVLYSLYRNGFQEESYCS